MEIEKNKKVPETVAIVAMGDTRKQYTSDVCRAGSRYGVADETWVINKLLHVFDHDILFRMDDLMQVRPCNTKVIKDIDQITIHERFDRALREHNKPIMTSIAYPEEYPMSMAYPLENVINAVGTSYFQTTPAYAVAYAIYIGVKRLRIYGCDYTYRESTHTTESGRSNLEHMLTIAIHHGLELNIADRSTLMNTNGPVEEYFYGYGGRIMEVLPDPDNEGRMYLNRREDVEEERRIAARRRELDELKELTNKYDDVIGEDCLALINPKIDAAKTEAAEMMKVATIKHDSPTDGKQSESPEIGRSCNTNDKEKN